MVHDVIFEFRYTYIIENVKIIQYKKIQCKNNT